MICSHPSSRRNFASSFESTCDVPFRQLLLACDDFAGKANDHVVVVRFAINRDRAECGALYLHRRILLALVCLQLQCAAMRRLDADIILAQDHSGHGIGAEGRAALQLQIIRQIVNPAELVE